MQAQEETQVCNKCHLPKPHPEFYRKGRGKLLYRTCNTCIATPMIKCRHCEVNRLPQDFERNGKVNKLCNQCSQKANNCPHGRQKYFCKDCGGKGRCEHNRPKHNCRECKGTQICPHNQRRQFCRDCNGSQICPHSGRLATCIECQGSQVCEHKRIRAQCRECNGSQICEHSTYRAHCKICQGSQICQHNRLRWTCKDCQGAGICEHGNRRSECRECGGTQICEHGVVRRKCVKCHGSGICEHNLQRTHCRVCQGSAICLHKRQHYHCRDCEGGSYCEHRKARYMCAECGGKGICGHDKSKFTCLDCNPEKACQYCHYVYVHSQSRYHPYCFRCFCVLNPDAEIPRKFKLKEHHLRDELKKEFPELKMVFDKQVSGGCSRRRPDVRIECLTHTVIVECDENRHISYTCEDKRMMELFQDLGNRPLVMIRFNPDSYVEDDTKVLSCFGHTKTGSLTVNKKEWRWRIKELKRAIKLHLSSLPTKEVTVAQLFFPT